MVVSVPPIIAGMLAGPVSPHALEQAFPLLTATGDGYCHVVLLSRTELSAAADEIHAAIRSRRTREHLASRPRACLMAVDGTAAHYLRLEVRRAVGDGPIGVAFTVTDHELDSVGVELTPMSFRVTPQLARVEDAQASAALLAELAATMPVRTDEEI